MRQHRHKKKQSELSWIKYLIYLGVFAIFVLAMAVYCLPFVTYYQVTSAIMVKDAGKLASHMDLEELRKNLKAQKGQRVIKQSKKKDAGDPSLVDLSITWSALTADQDIDRAITTEGFYVAFSSAGGKNPNKMPSAAEGGTYSFVKKLVDTASFQYRSSSKFVVSTKDEQGRYVEYFSFIFTRDGLTWRLSNVMLPVF